MRINPTGTSWFTDDDMRLAVTLAREGLGGLMVPKAEQASTFVDAAGLCPGLSLMPLIESGAGLDALDAIARAPGVARLSLGHLDLQNDLGMQCEHDEHEIAPARWAMVRSSRRAGLLPPVDGVTGDTRDPAAVTRDSRRAQRLGFGGKLCIHPTQVPAVHEAFTPTAEAMPWARRVLIAASAAGGNVCSVDGKMVDAPVIASARRVLARHAAASRAEPA